MELEFQEIALSCLKKAVGGTKTEEQTLEIKLPEAMPDIGRVLGARGQPLLRGKEWKGSSIQITGGIMAWALYAPEDGSMPRTVEGWIPFQMRWELPEACRDGSILADIRLESIDSRSISARKLLVRAAVSLSVQALAPEKLQLAQPAQLPREVQVLREKYPVELTLEAGERVFEMEEELPLPENCAQAEKVLYCALEPRISECKLMGDKLVFRGVAQLRLLLRCEGGAVQSCDFPLPFSQYAELEQSYASDARGSVIPCVTALDAELVGGLRIKLGLVGQYAVSAPRELELVTDAYSTQRELQLQTRELELPSVLDACACSVAAEALLPPSCRELQDVFITAGHPRQSRAGECVEITLPGTVSLLCADEEGHLHGEQQHWEGQTSVPADRAVEMLCAGVELQTPVWERSGEALTLRQEAQVQLRSNLRGSVGAVSGLTLGEPKPKTRCPSLILKRAEAASLWETAKQCGSTVDAILEANGLTQEPEPGVMLLIPIQ